MNNFRKFILNSKSIMALAIPIFGAQIAQSAMGVTDTIMAGKYASQDLAAIGVASGLFIPLMLLLVGTLIAVLPITAQAFGADKHQEIRGVGQSAIAVGMIMAIPIAIILNNSGSILNWMGISGSVSKIAEEYLLVMIFALPALVIFQVLRGLCESSNKPMPVLIISIIGLILNIPLNYIFIYGKLGLEPMGAVGSGYATMICQWAMTIGLIIYIKTSPLEQIKIMFSKFIKPDKKQTVDIIKIGLPIGAAIFISSSVFTTVALMIGSMGTTVIAGHMIAMSFSGVVFIIPLSISMALTVKVAYSVSKNNTLDTQIISRMGIILGAIIAIICSILIFLFAGNIVRAYSNDIEVQVLAIALIKLAAIYQMPNAIQLNISGVLRGYKDTKSLLLISLIAFWIVGVGSGWILANKFNFGVFGFWYGLIAGLTLAAVLTILRLFHIESNNYKVKNKI